MESEHVEGCKLLEDEEWISKLVFLTDICFFLCELSMSLQGKDCLLPCCIRYFLLSWKECRLPQSNINRFFFLQQVVTGSINCRKSKFFSLKFMSTQAWRLWGRKEQFLLTATDADADKHRVPGWRGHPSDPVWPSLRAWVTMSGVSTCRFYWVKSWPTSKGTRLWSTETRLKSMLHSRGSAVPLAFLCIRLEGRLVIPYFRSWGNQYLRTEPLVGCGKGLTHTSMGMLRRRNLAANKQERINAPCGGCTQAEHGPCWPLHHGDTQDACPRWQEGGRPLTSSPEWQRRKRRGNGDPPTLLVLALCSCATESALGKASSGWFCAISAFWNATRPYP